MAPNIISLINSIFLEGVCSCRGPSVVVGGVPPRLLSVVLRRVAPAARGGADGGPPAVVAVGAVPVVVPADLDRYPCNAKACSGQRLI